MLLLIIIMINEAYSYVVWPLSPPCNGLLLYSTILNCMMYSNTIILYSLAKKVSPAMQMAPYSMLTYIIKTHGKYVDNIN